MLCWAYGHFAFTWYLFLPKGRSQPLLVSWEVRLTNTDWWVVCLAKPFQVHGLCSSERWTIFEWRVWNEVEMVVVYFNSSSICVIDGESRGQRQSCRRYTGYFKLTEWLTSQHVHGADFLRNQWCLIYSRNSVRNSKLVQNNPMLGSIINKMNSLRIFLPSFCNIHFNIMLLYTLRI